MKAKLLSLAIALLMVGCGEDAVGYWKLQDRGGVMYLPNEETPFTGRAEGFYYNGQMLMKVNLKDGKRDGLWTKWYENGQKKEESNWKDGKIWSALVWKSNGEKCPVTNVRDGNGLRVEYNDNGTERGYRQTYKDGEEVRN